MKGNGTNESLHEKFAREAQDNDVKADKGKVARAFAILRRGIGIGAGLARKRVGEEDGGREGIRFRGIYEIEREDGECDDEGEEPGVTEAEALALGKGASNCAPLRTTGRLVALHAS